VKLYLPSVETAVPKVLLRVCVLEKTPVLDIGLMGVSSALSGGSVINLTTSLMSPVFNENIGALHPNTFFPRRWRAAIIFSERFYDPEVT